MNTTNKSKIGMLLFPDLTILDFTGPYDVFIRASCFEVYIVSQNKNPIKAEGGLTLIAEYTFNDCPDVDILFVPGGRGVTPLLTNKVYHTFIQTHAAHALYITSVCTGSLLLAAAGVLAGYKATTHWRSMELLKMFGIETEDARVVTDRNRITGGGITAGIDFGLVLTAMVGVKQWLKRFSFYWSIILSHPISRVIPVWPNLIFISRLYQVHKLFMISERKLLSEYLYKCSY